MLKTSNISKKPGSALKYLKHYAEPEVNYLDGFPAHLHYEHVLVIPAYNETPDFLLRLLNSFSHDHNILVILVINQPDSDPCTDANESLWCKVTSSGQEIWHHQNLSLIQTLNSNLSFLAIQRFNEPLKIPEKQGVGLARKIGCDVAVSLAERSQITSPWIHSSDADACWPRDYFSQTESHNNCSAAVYSFSHDQPEGKLGCAMRLYEQSLHYYVNALHWAGSPYAFHTIGSCLAISRYHYCQARGFPKRSGGEDFYLLNKLAKLQKVGSLSGEPIGLEARESNRVPFGTGPALKKIMILADPEREFLSYHPNSFLRLKELLQAFSTLWQHLDSKPVNSRDADSKNTNPVTKWYETLPRETVAALKEMDFQSCLDHQQRQVTTQEQSLHHLHSWFDGFRTLKFIHLLQQNEFPAVPLTVGVAEFQRHQKHEGI